ncbi:MAG: hypothetical protein PF549_04505 [Patescibacteria group bacterium]|nr:hypothetical protein [Patescibacteria group bacterium]
MEQKLRDIKFEGAIVWGKSFLYAVFADYYDENERLYGGGRVANFNERKLVKKCCNQVNKIDLRYNAHVFKKPLLRRLGLKYYRIKRHIKEYVLVKRRNEKGNKK